MSFGKTIGLLLSVFIFLTIFTLISFDYSYFGVDTKKELTPIKQNIVNKKDITIEIKKENNQAVVYGMFKSEEEAIEITNYINANIISTSSYDPQISYNQNNIDELKNLVSPLKDYFEDDSKIVLKAKIITISGILKDDKFIDLIDAILAKSDVKIKKDIKQNKVAQKVEEEILEPIIEEINIQEELTNALKTNIKFNKNSSRVTNTKTINEIANIIKNAKKDIKLKVITHTSTKGKKSSNKWISQKRAETIRKALLKAGLKSDKIIIKGMGEELGLKKSKVEIQIIDVEKLNADIQATQTKINRLVEQQKITFKRRSTKPTKDSLKVIKLIAELINKNENLTYEIGGHTDAKGSNKLNKRISQNRANSVRSELIKFKVDKSILKAIGYGEDFPIAKNDKIGLQPKNRRVEFKVGGIK